MKERGILFKPEMIAQILAGNKTMTRRVAKIKNGKWQLSYEANNENRTDLNAFGVLDENKNLVEVEEGMPGTLKELNLCPYNVGDLLYVKESYYNSKAPYIYQFVNSINPYAVQPSKWISPLFMPKAAARIWLQIIDVRVERLQDITEQDAINEGMFFTDYGRTCYHNGFNGDITKCPADEKHHPVKPGWHYKKTNNSDECLGSARSAFANIWQSINGEDSWQRNPFVWCISFKQVNKNGATKEH